MNINNDNYQSVDIDWNNITLPLKAGTPIDKDGHIANNSNAMGIVPLTIPVRPREADIYLCVAGDVNKAEVEAASGLTLSDDAISAMKGIRFWYQDSGVWTYASSGGDSSLPSVTASDNGDVLTVVEGAWAKATPSGLQVDYILQDGESGVTIESGTFTDISAKLKNGEPVIGIWRSVFEDAYETDYITQHTYDDYTKEILFSNGSSVSFIWSENGTIVRG